MYHIVFRLTGFASLLTALTCLYLLRAAVCPLGGGKNLAMEVGRLGLRPLTPEKKSHLLKASMIGGPEEDAGRSPSFYYTLKFAFHLRKITKENAFTVDESWVQLLLSI